MDEIINKKQQLRDNAAKFFEELHKKKLTEKIAAIEKRLFQFANFLESKIILLYVNSKNEVPTKSIIEKTYSYGKIIVLPVFQKGSLEMKLMKIDNLSSDLSKGPRGILQPLENKCKIVPIECIDIAIIPGVAMDEKGGRIGSGNGYYDRLIPKLSISTRKVGLAFDNQIKTVVPMEPHDKYIDIIITENRTIYKI